MEKESFHGTRNETAVTEFIPEGFSALDQRLQLFLSLVLLLMYLTTVMGNTTIIFLVCGYHRLQTPMYFFISNLSFLEIWFTSSTSIKLFVILGSGRRTISLSSCFAQSYFYFALGCTAFVLLVVMSFDRYVATCQPLRYAAIMKPQLCIQLVVAAWVIGITLLSYRLVLLYQLIFCGSNKIHHFFSDNSPLFKLFCSDSSLLWKTDSVLVSFIILASLCLTLAFYMGILFWILHLPAASGRKKTFATCSSHLTTLAIVYGSCIAL
uniref:G-protein coupled receptors family 1 profile domain-containing protein n=1 Tax=Bubo bubo TaxID=30461 RepID=A0A8C0FM43_BUBBB